MKKLLILLLITAGLPALAQVGINDEYILTTIILKDKSDKVIAQKALSLLNPDDTEAARGKTDINGEFKARLKRGITYTVFFTEGGQDWYYEVPISTDASAAYFKTVCRILIDQGTTPPPVGERNCAVTISLLSAQQPMANQAFTLENVSGEKMGDYTTGADGKCTVTLKQGLRATLRIKAHGNTYSSAMTVPSTERTVLEISIPTGDPGSTTDPNAGKCKVNFQVTDDIGVAEGTAVVKLSYNGQNVYTGETDIEGKCSTWVEQHKTYDMSVQKFGKTFTMKLEMPIDSKLSEFDYGVRIKIVEHYTRTYTLENVYFDVDKWDLKPVSYVALDQLYAAMKANPDMTVELAGHTDSDADDSHNMILSQRRADAVMKYITDKGIAKNRIMAKGYGERVPIVPNDTPANKAKNRRTEVRVISE